MIFFKVILIAIWALGVPYLMGLLFREKCLKKDNLNAGHAIVTGYFLMFAVFYLLTMPLLLASASLSLLVILFASVCGLTSIISVILCHRRIKNHMRSGFTFFKNSSVIFWIAILIIILQTGVLTVYQHIDDDDAFFVATSTTAVETNTIVEIDPYTGEVLTAHRMRYVMSPFPVYTAVFSRLVMMHPTIVAHTVFPAVFIPLAFLVAYLLISNFFEYKRQPTEYALLFLALLTIFGNTSVYTSSTFLLFRIWQGKAMLANVFLPGILLYGTKAMARTRVRKDWIIIAAAVLGACLSSSMAVALVPILLGLLSVIYAIKKRQFSPIFMSLLCLVPCIICGLLYINP